jgi:hypothetical protein
LTLSIASVQGKTVEVGRAYFETENTRFTILDAPVFLFSHITVLLISLLFACMALFWFSGFICGRTSIVMARL